MEIKVRIVSQYGQQRIQPVCEKALLFCRIANAKTLTDANVQAIKALGYTITVVQDALVL